MAQGYPKDFILYDVSHEEVYLSGSWCDWKPNAIKMTKIPNLYFIATVLLPYNTKVAYKYIVNGNWMANPEEQTETDAAGNTNNVFTTPSEAEAPAQVAPVAASSSGITAPLTGATSSSSTGSSGVSKEIKDAEASGVPIGGSAAQSGVAEAAAETAAAAGFGQTANHGNVTGASEEIMEAKTSGVPVGAEAARSGVAEEAAEVAAAAGFGKSGNASSSTGVTGVEKVAPNVTQATSGSSTSGVGSDRELAKPDVPSSGTSSSGKAPLPASTADAPLAPGSATHEDEHKGLFSVIGGLTAAAAAAATKAAYELEHKIEEKIHEVRATSPASSGVLGAEGTKSATQTPAVPANTSSEKMITTASAGALSSGGSSNLSGSAAASQQHNKDPGAALDPIATNAGVAKITKEFAAVDFDHTKAEVVHAVERLGEVIAGGLTGIGAAHEGRELPAINDFWAKKGSASATSAFGKSIHNVPETTGQNGVTPLGGMASFSSPAAAWPANTGAPPAVTATGSSNQGSSVASQAKDGSSSSAAPTLPPVTGGPALYPTDKSAPADIKIDTPKTTPGQVQAESAKAGAHAPALNGSEGVGASKTTGASSVAAPSSTTTGTSAQTDGKKTGIMEKLKQEVKGDKATTGSGSAGTTSASPATTTTADKGGMLGPAAVAEHEAHGLINTNKKDPSTLGVATGASASGPPTTPKKTAAGAPSSSSAATPATPKTDGYNTAPSTPSGTPADRKRKSSIFHKIKSALSPSK